MSFFFFFSKNIINANFFSILVKFYKTIFIKYKDIHNSLQKNAIFLKKMLNQNNKLIYKNNHNLNDYKEEVKNIYKLISKSDNILG